MRNHIPINLNRSKIYFRVRKNARDTLYGDLKFSAEHAKYT